LQHGYSNLLVPLSGYEIRQDFTYTPNGTGTTLPYSGIIPAPIRKRPSSFIPHTFVIGETFQTDSDFGVFDYVIESANYRDDTLGSSTPRVGAEVSSFLYMNHGLSTCDVMSITLDTTLPPPGQPWAYPHTVASVCPPILQSFIALNLTHRHSLAAGFLSFTSFVRYTVTDQPLFEVHHLISCVWAQPLRQSLRI
jgi:hypothetical protein